MAKKSQCEQCDKYNAERGLCRKDWSLVVFDDTECGLLVKENGQSNTEKEMTPSNVQEQEDNQSRFENNRRPNLRESVITVSSAGIAHMQSIAKWTKFLSIVAIIEMILFIFGCLVISVYEIRENGRPNITMLLIIACGCYPIKKSFGMASHMKNSVFCTDSKQLEYGLNDLRSIIKYMSVMAIIMFPPFAFLIIAMIGVGIDNLF